MFKWVNFHLTNADTTKWITNLGGDLHDSKALLVLMNQLDAEKCPLDALKEQDDLKRAEMMLEVSRNLGVADVVGADDII